MEDSTAKTIYYLRARLLAERSVSKTARQRAYELAKRVTELEKQLKLVSLQRKKAEKAAADVLAILENHGKNDITEPTDSSFDEEMSSDFMDDKHVETEEFSGSEVESSSVNGKSLSWKNSKNGSSRFLDKKYMDASRRRRNSFTSTGSSPRRVGKSCRQIRHREHRSGAGVSQNDDAINGHHENEGQTSSEGIQNSADLATETSIMCNGHAVQNNGTETEMERALERQAQFIAQYEEEEKAQREWEDKFRENNGSTPDNSCDPGTHSDVTEETAETKAPSPLPPGATETLPSGGQSIDHGAVNPNLSENPKTDPEPLPDHNAKKEPLDSQSQPPDLQGIPTNLSQSQASSSQGKSYEPDLETDLETEKGSDKLGSVLEALQQAKLSLKQNLDKFPLLENGPSVSNYRGMETFPVPFSSAGLFRVPTDYEYEGTPLRANSLTYDPRLSSTSYSDDPTGRQFISSPYRESFSRSTSSLDDRFRMVPTFPYQETMPEIPRLPPSVLNPRLDIHPSARDPLLETGLGPPALDPRLGMGSSGLDPRLGMAPNALDRRLGVGPSALDPRLGLGQSQSSFEPRLGVGLAAHDPRAGVGQTAFAHDPRAGVGPTARLPLSSRYGTPLQTRSYDEYTRPNMYK